MDNKVIVASFFGGDAAQSVGEFYYSDSILLYM